MFRDPKTILWDTENGCLLDLVFSALPGRSAPARCGKRPAHFGKQNHDVVSVLSGTGAAPEPLISAFCGAVVSFFLGCMRGVLNEGMNLD